MTTTNHCPCSRFIVLLMSLSLSVPAFPAATGKAGEAAGATKKWYPGHYVMVSPDTYSTDNQNIERGLRGYLAYINADGSVSHTCKACLCPGKGTKEDYKNYGWLPNDPHAFGPVVLAFTQGFRLGITRIEPLGNSRQPGTGTR